jgi:hypothetical protein
MPDMVATGLEITPPHKECMHTMTMIKLHKITRASAANAYNDTDDPEERRPEETTLARINPLRIRCYYARKDNRVGSRITFSDGGGFAVAETPEMIDAMLEGDAQAAALSGFSA